MVCRAESWLRVAVRKGPVADPAFSVRRWTLIRGFANSRVNSILDASALEGLVCLGLCTVLHLGHELRTPH